MANESTADAPAASLRSGPPRPTHRRVAVFALDPSLTQHLETRDVGTVMLEIPWEPLRPGPIGEYLEVIDVDPTSGCYYEPVDLDHPHLLARGGLAPSEGPVRSDPGGPGGEPDGKTISKPGRTALNED